METIRVSVIINTYNRSNELQRLLKGLDHLEAEPFEVVVVNGPSTDDTESVLEKYQGRIKLIKCPNLNLSESRNLGIAAASGDIVVFIDDDSLPGNVDWLSQYLKSFQEDKMQTVAALGGPVWHHDSQWAEFKNGATSDYGFQKFGNVLDNVANNFKGIWYKGIAGGNSAFRRKKLIEIGGFDEFYKYYLDESDVCVRLARAGYIVDFLPENGIRHYKNELRSKPINISWDTITRSDTYFAVKNGSDILPIKLLKIFLFAPKKHYFKEINQFLKNNNVSFREWLQLIKKWATGFASGLFAGLFQPRSLGNFKTPPTQFLPYNIYHKEAKLRIALLSQTLPGQSTYGGIGRYVYDLAVGLHERGHDVHIICRDEEPIRHENLEFTIHGISTDNLQELPELSDRPILHKNLSYSLAVTNKLYELYSQGIEFDVVHAPNWDVEGISLIRAKIYPIVLEVVTSLASVILTEQMELNKDLLDSLALDRWQLKNADVVCVPSRGICTSYERLMNITHEETMNWQVVPLGIIPKDNKSPQFNNLLKRLLFVGRLERRKGIHTLLAILPKLLTEFTDWECHIIGDDQIPIFDGGTFKNKFLEQYSGAPWLDRVIFHGKVNEETLHQHYQHCDLFVAPSLQESFGLIYHEAMQYGKAVVGCKVGGVPEVVEHGIEGLLVTPDCPEELLDALVMLMRNKDLRERMGLAGFDRIQRKNNYRTMAENMEQIYLLVNASVDDERRANRINRWKKIVS